MAKELQRENLSTVKQALQSRLCAGLTALSTHESRLSVLSNTVQQVASQMSSLAIANERVTEKSHPYLFGCLNGKANQAGKALGKSYEALQSNHCCKPLDVGTPWMNIIGDNCVIGIDIVNASKSEISNIHLIVSTSLHQVTHTPKFFKPEDDAFPMRNDDPPSRKKMCTEKPSAIRSGTEWSLQSGRRAIVTTVLKSDVLNHNLKVRFDLVITFERHVDDNVINGSVPCASFALSYADFYNSDFSLDLSNDRDKSSVLRAKAVLETLTVPIYVTIVSTSTSLNRFHETLQARADLSYSTGLKVLYKETKNSMTLLSNAWIEVITVESANCAHVCIHAKNQNQFFAIVHYLYDHLPEDVLILPHTQSKPATLASCLSAELNFLSNFFQDNASDESECHNIEIATYQEFRAELLKYEQSTDEAFALDM